MAMAAIQAQAKHREEEQKKVQNARKEKLLHVFEKFDDGDVHVLSRSQAGGALSELFDVEASAEELDYLFRTVDKDPEVKNISLDEFRSMVRVYNLYLDDFRDPEGDYAKLYEELDTDHSGGLNKDQLRSLLEKYSGEGKVTDQDVEVVLQAADVSKTGEVRKIELRLALAVWFQRMCQMPSEAEAGTNEAGHKPQKEKKGRSSTKPSRSCCMM